MPRGLPCFVVEHVVTMHEDLRCISGGDAEQHCGADGDACAPRARAWRKFWRAHVPCACAAKTVCQCAVPGRLCHNDVAMRQVFADVR